LDTGLSPPPPPPRQHYGSVNADFEPLARSLGSSAPPPCSARCAGACARPWQYQQRLEREEGALNGPAVALLKVRDTPFLCLCPSLSLILLEAGSRPCLQGERAAPALSKTRSRPPCLQGERAAPALSKTHCPPCLQGGRAAPALSKTRSRPRLSARWESSPCPF